MVDLRTRAEAAAHRGAHVAELHEEITRLRAENEALREDVVAIHGAQGGCEWCPDDLGECPVLIRVRGVPR